MPTRPTSRVIGLFAAALALTACGAASSDSAAEATTVTVTASDTACELDTTEVPGGATVFVVTNTGDEITEVYVYAEAEGKFTTVVSEVENIGPGTSRDMEVELSAGTYEIACKPGQTGDGIRTELIVEGGESSSSTVAAREVELSIDAADALVGIDAIAASSSERLEFKVTNGASTARIFEVKRPDGTVAGEIEIEPAAEGELYVDLTVAGDWALIVEGGAEETTATLSVA